MERLTHRYEGGQAWVSMNLVSKMGENECVGLPIAKLANYEDLEEQGLLIRLPCKVGDILYVINKNKLITEEKVYDVQYRGVKYQEGQRWFINIGALAYFEMDFGKNVFLTQAEAEEALKKMNETEE